MNDLASLQTGYGAYKQYASDDPTMAQLARQTLALVLAGGRGARLGPLTDWRAKPAVPFGGKFRIIDFALVELRELGHPPHRHLRRSTRRTA